jgi:hypothetical protein
MTMIDVATKKTMKNFVGAFVDDVSQFANNDHNRQDVQELQQTLKNDGQTWSGLLSASGGLIEITKSFYYILSWLWDKNGNPKPQTNNQQNLESNNIPLIDDKGQVQYLQQREVSKSHKTLGTYKCMNGDESDHITFLKTKSDEIAANASNGKFNRKQANLAYSTSYIPSMIYSLPAMCLKEKTIYDIQKRALYIFLQLIGYEGKFPRAVVFGPTQFGGLDFRQLFTESMCRKIEALTCHLNACSELGIMACIDLTGSNCIAA